MKKIILLLMCGSLTFITSGSFAAEKNTDLSKKWTCTTNASSASKEADKAADDKMANKAISAKDAYSYAVKNCRDCTKITCEVSK